MNTWSYPPRTHCADCEMPATVHFGFVSRCHECAERFTDRLHAERCEEFRSERERQSRHVCGQVISNASDSCSECCDHSDTDDYSCLDCGKELLEDRMCAAYDRVKAARQDG